VSSHRVAGSYRDPSGFVFWHEDRLYRALDSECHRVLARLSENGCLAELIRKRMMVQTEFVSDVARLDALRREHPGYDQFLEHEVLSTITYPYEWSVSMLADAAICTLDLQMDVLRYGCSLKDATAYNVQFVGGRPVFIDVSSLEQPKRLDLWFALGQFAQMFLFPLLLCRYRGWDLRSYFLGSLQGRPIEEVAKAFGLLDRLHPRLLLDLTIPLWLHRGAEKRSQMQREVLERPSSDTRAQVLNLRRLRRKIVKLAAGYRTRSIWSEYTTICNYGASAEEAKKGMVRDFLTESQPARVLDLGCNTGDYSRLAAECGAEVIAADSDHDAIEMLYRDLRKAPKRITPVVLDLGNPSPGIGYMNRERMPFFERIGAECVLALALIHHLVVSANLSLAAVCELMAAMTKRDLVLEFVPRDDSMFQRLMKFRVDLYGDMTLEACREAFARRFRLIKEVPIPDSKRTLLFFRKRVESQSVLVASSQVPEGEL
jgi:hypothetical protein